MISERRPTEVSGSSAASKEFCWNLSQGLHAAAQPLSILRAGLGNPRLGEMSHEKIRKLASISAIEVERVCTLFHYLQQLVKIESIEPELIATPILPLLAHAAEGVDLLFRQSGLSLKTTEPDDGQPVLINLSRTLEVLSSVLLIAHAVSRPGDTVELIAACDSSSAAVRVVIRNLNAHIAELKADASLGMSLAAANMRSQRGTLTWSLQPFAVEIVCPDAATRRPL